MAQPISGGYFSTPVLAGYIRAVAPAERWGGYAMSERIMSDEFDSLNGTEKAAAEVALIRCRVLAAKIANELRNKRPEHFVDKLSLADIHTSLERAADVLSTLKGWQARGRQRRR